MKFEKPELVQRIKIWQSMMPELSEKTAEHLASVYDFSGGQIENITRKFHREHFGHPSEYGYKELCRDWKTGLWDSQVDLGIDMGLGRLTPQIFLQLFFIKRMIFAEFSLHL